MYKKVTVADRILYKTSLISSGTWVGHLNTQCWAGIWRNQSSKFETPENVARVWVQMGGFEASNWSTHFHSAVSINRLTFKLTVVFHISSDHHNTHLEILIYRSLFINFIEIPTFTWDATNCTKKRTKLDEEKRKKRVRQKRQDILMCDVAAALSLSSFRNM